MESCVSQQHYVTPGATSLPMGEYVQMPPDMGPHPCNPTMSSYLESLPPGVGMPEYPWMKEKKTVRKPPQQGESARGTPSPPACRKHLAHSSLHTIRAVGDFSDMDLPNLCFSAVLFASKDCGC